MLAGMRMRVAVQVGLEKDYTPRAILCVHGRAHWQILEVEGLG